MTISNGIPNLFAVEQDILRGGQPSSVGWDYLKSQGITDVIKLNTEEEGVDPDGAGFSIHRLPIPWWRQMIFRPSQSLIVAAVSLMRPHTYVHCEHGEDRTGLIVGCFRLSQGWTKNDAYSEMLAHYFHPALQGLQGRWNSEIAANWITGK